MLVTFATMISLIFVWANTTKLIKKNENLDKYRKKNYIIMLTENRSQKTEVSIDYKKKFYKVTS